jgi:5-hydroxyisourate hydrolase
MSPITTHVLDTAQGRPAAGLRVLLEIGGTKGRFRAVARGTTDANGRLGDLLPEGSLRRGTYRLTFDTARYYRARGVRGFYPSVSVLFEIHEPRQHYHVPLLLSPFGYSTYRGS